MSKIIQAVLAGVLFTFILDFFLFLGIKLNYIDTYNINVYYNILFADHQNIFLYATLSLLFGFLIIYANHKISISTAIVFALLASSTLISPVGNKAGEILLMKKNITLHDDKYSYHGDIYYDGRKTIAFYDYELKKVIILKKNRLKETSK